MKSEPIPFLDLVTPHRELEEQLLSVVQRAFRTAGFVGGPMVEQFENDFARFCTTRTCVAVNSGTDALRFALIASGIGAGQSVITVPNTFIATTEAISQTGAVPEFVDIDERTYNMDVVLLERYIEENCRFDPNSHELFSNRTARQVKAIVPVHLYGQMANMDAILDLAERYHLVVIEDACQAHGALYFSKKRNGWHRAGSMGLAAAFSFYPGKNLGACGEGGAVTTNDADLAQRIRILRDHGQAKKYFHDLEGYNGRLDAIQAGLLDVKLAHLSQWNDERREAALRYMQLLDGHRGVGLPYVPEWVIPVYHLFVVRVKDRTGLMKHLSSEGIGTAIHYPIPLHAQKAYVHLGYHKGDFPITEAVAEEITSLPMFPQLTADQQVRVADAVLSFVEPESEARQLPELQELKAA